MKGQDYLRERLYDLADIILNDPEIGADFSDTLSNEDLVSPTVLDAGVNRDGSRVAILYYLDDQLVVRNENLKATRYLTLDGMILNSLRYWVEIHHWVSNAAMYTRQKAIQRLERWEETLTNGLEYGSVIASFDEPWDRAQTTPRDAYLSRIIVVDVPKIAG